jgi:hypothetical protein
MQRDSSPISSALQVTLLYAHSKHKERDIGTFSSSLDGLKGREENEHTGFSKSEP